MNTFGTRLKFTTFGESHGKAVGCVIDGLPAGLKIDEDFLQNELDKRRGGKKFTTPRKESDKAEILSGVFEGFSTGTPLAIVIYNENQHSKDYESIKDLFRPAHADFTYFAKYGIRDYRGGGRASARESVARVAAGAVAQMLLNEFNISVQSGVFGVGEVKSALKNTEFDFEFAKKSEIFALDKELERAFKEQISKAQSTKDSVGAAVFTQICGVMAGLGEPLYDKLESKLAHAFMGINAVKAVEIGNGVDCAWHKGSQNNDLMRDKAFLSNRAGGILGGISSGENIEIKSYFKPTPSIFLAQETINKFGENTICELKGRHDACVGVRGSVVCTAMARLVIADSLLLNANSSLQRLKKAYEL